MHGHLYTSTYMQCMYIAFYLAIADNSLYIFYRNPNPRSRPQFGQIAKILDSNSGYLLSWSDEDKQNNDEGALKLGFPLEASRNLFYDLQTMYK